MELFHEQSYTNAPWPWTVKGEDGFHRLPRMAGLPTHLLVARSQVRPDQFLRILAIDGRTPFHIPIFDP